MQKKAAKEKTAKEKTAKEDDGEIVSLEIREQQPEYVKLLKTFTTREIEDEEDREASAELLKKVSKARAGMDQERKISVAPLKEEAKRIDEAYKPFLTAADKLIAAIKGAIGRYEIRAHQEAQRLLAAAAEEQDDTQSTALVEQAAATSGQKTQGVSVSTKWDWEVVNLAKVPVEYTYREINAKAVDAAVEAGVRDIPGLKIFQKAIVRAARK